MMAALVCLMVLAIIRAGTRKSRGGCIINELPPIPSPTLHFGPMEGA